MCLVHDSELHYVYQNLMEAFEQSKMISALFQRRVGCLVCNCKKDMLYDSKTLIATQRSLYQWFDEALVDPRRQPISQQRLAQFKPIVEEFRQSGQIDSGTKITFLSLLKDLDAYDFSKLRRITEQPAPQKSLSRFGKPQMTTNVFFTKLVKLKFDLKLCSIKEFCELLTKIDNCAIKYIQATNKCKITLRDLEHLGIRHFMGEIDATIETRNEKNLYRAELSLKRLADAVHYRLAKQIPCSDMIVGGNSFAHLKVLLQSPPQSLNSTSASEASTESDLSRMSSSFASSSAADTTTTTSTSYTSDLTTTTTTSTSFTTTTTTDLSTSKLSSRSSNTLADSSLNSSATPVSSASSSGAKKSHRKHRRSRKSKSPKVQDESSSSAAVQSKSSPPSARKASSRPSETKSAEKKQQKPQHRQRSEPETYKKSRAYHAYKHGSSHSHFNMVDSLAY